MDRMHSNRTMRILLLAFTMLLLAGTMTAQDTAPNSGTGDVAAQPSLSIFGESMNGVPATTAMHFRNGAVAFAHLGTLLMKFVDEKKIKLDDTIERWMSGLPEANKVTLKMLANQTSGYPDFETDPKFLAAFNADPFHIFTFEERLKIAFSRPTS